MSAGRVLAVFAHPDDETLLAGGTLAACAAAGGEVTVVSATAGECGPVASSGLATRANLGAVRRAELRAAARALGAVAECLGLPDGGLAGLDPEAVVPRLVRVLRRRRPDVVLTFGPEGWYWHPDHVAVHDFMRAALDRVAGDGRTPWLYCATWPAGRMGELVAAVTARGLPADLWGLDPAAFGAPAASITTVCDVRPFLPAKLRALRSHRSQLTRGHLLDALPDDLAAEFLGREFFVRARPREAAADRLTGPPPALRAGQRRVRGVS